MNIENDEMNKVTNQLDGSSGGVPDVARVYKVGRLLVLIIVVLFESVKGPFIQTGSHTFMGHSGAYIFLFPPPLPLLGGGFF